MATNKITPIVVYGIDQSIVQLPPHPIVANRAPTTSDKAQLGQFWVDTTTDTVYCLCSMTANVSNWTTSPASGSGSFTSATINPGDLTVTAGDIIVTAGDLTLGSGNASIGGDLTVSGTTSLNGDIDFSSTALIDFTSSLDAAPSILLHADGGTSEQIYLHADQGTAVNSILLDSDVGGITLLSGLASADAINLTATAGGLDLDGALQVNIASSQNAASAIVINASAGGIDLTNTGTAGEDIDIASTGASVNISASEAVSTAITLTASDAAGGITVASGTGGTALDSTGAISLDGAAASNFSVSGAGIDLNVESAAGRVVLDGGEAAADAISITASDVGGGITVASGTAGIIVDTTGAISLDAAAASNYTVTGAGIDLTLDSAAGRVVLDGGEAAADALSITASDVAGGITAAAGTGGIIVDTTGAISLDAAAASNYSVSGAGIDLTLLSAAGRVIIDGGEAAVNAVTIGATDAAGGIDINAGTGGITIDSGDAISIDAVAASNITTTGAGIDLTLSSVGGSLVLDADEASATAIGITASDAAGGITLTAGTGGIIMSSGGNVQIAPVTASVAGVSTTANGRVFKCTFTGQTTASGATEDFTITNSASGAGDGIFVTVANAGSNDAKMTLERVNVETAGTIIVETQNNGSAALNGNVIISGWIID